MTRRTTFRWLLAAFFIAAGANHFRDPAFYLRAMPMWLPWHRRLIDLSGRAEILGGIGLLWSASRRAAGYGLVALLIAVFPANVQVALRVAQSPERHGGDWLLWLRLPLQALLMTAVWWVAASESAKARRGR